MAYWHSACQVDGSIHMIIMHKAHEDCIFIDKLAVVSIIIFIFRILLALEAEELVTRWCCLPILLLVLVLD